MSESPFSALGNMARDCVFLAAGVGVIAVQKAQVARRELLQRSDRREPVEATRE